jgi:Holliday junction resolvase RusA-like endonuclease
MWSSYFFITLNLQPVAMGRPRFNRMTGRTYLPQKTKETLQQISHLVKHQMLKNNVQPIPKKTPIFVSLVFVHRRPKSHKKTVERSPKTTKPDIDNIAKTYLDGMTRSGLMYDDNQVTLLQCEDLYGATDEAPHVIINVSIWRGTDEKTWLHHSDI